MNMRQTICALTMLLVARAGVAVEGSDSNASDARFDTYTLTGSYNEDDAYAVHAGAAFAIGSASNLQIDLGLNHSPQELADLTTYRGGLGFDYDFDPVGVSIGYEYWGDRKSIDTQTVRGALYAHGAAGRLALLAEYRTIDLSFDVPIAARGFVDDSKSAHATGFGASARHAGERVDIYASGMKYDYDTDIGRLSSIIDLSRVPLSQRPTIIQRLTALVLTLGRLNASSLTLANSFLDYTISAGIDVHFGERLLNVEFAHDAVVTDDSKLNSGSVGFLHPLCDRCDIEYRLGVSHDDVIGSSTFGSITFYWYK